MEELLALSENERMRDARRMFRSCAPGSPIRAYSMRHIVSATMVRLWLKIRSYVW